MSSPDARCSSLPRAKLVSERAGAGAGGRGERGRRRPAASFSSFVLFLKFMDFSQCWCFGAYNVFDLKVLV